MKTYAFGPFRLDADDLRLNLRESTLPLGPKIVETLLALAERAGETCTKQELLARVWPQGFSGETNLAQNIYVLRRTLREYWRAPVIETVRGRGYKFVAPLLPAAAPSPGRLHSLWAAAVLSALLVAAAFLPSALSPARGGSAGLTPDNARLYALGRYYWNTRTRANVLKSIGYFRRIVQSQPAGALGYTGLADAYFAMADYEYGPKSPKTYQAWQRTNVERALALDPNLSEAHASMGQLHETSDRDLKTASQEFARAIELDPNNSVAHYWFGINLLIQGKLDDSQRELNIALRLNPASPVTNMWLASREFFARRYDDAIAYYRQALDLDPDREDAISMLATIYELKGSYRTALRLEDRLVAVCNCDSAFAIKARTLALMGNVLGARAALDRAKHSRIKTHDSLDMALALLALGQREQALALLRRYPATDPRDNAWLAFDPRLDPVRSDPRFVKLLGLAQRHACSSNVC